MVKEEKNDPVASHPAWVDSFLFVLENVSEIDEKTIIYQSLFLSRPFCALAILFYPYQTKVLMHLTFHHPRFFYHPIITKLG